MFKKSDIDDNGDAEPVLPNLDMEFDFPLSEKSDLEKTNEECLFDRISEISKQGYAFLNEGDTKNASIEFMRVLDLDSQNNYALVGLGDAARREKKYDKAMKYYEDCLEHHSQNNYALFGLADCYKAQRKYKKAIQVWQRYLQFDPDNIAVLTRIADSHRKDGDFDKAKFLYNKVLVLSENNSYALIGLGHLYYDFKKYREALGYWLKVVELSSSEGTDIRILTSIGNCYRKLKNFNRALHYFLAAVDKDSKNFYALFGLADCYRGLNKHSDSIQYWQRIIDLDPNNKVILTRLGDAYRNIKNYEEAENCYKKALSIAYDSYAVLGLVILKKEKGLYEEAIKDFNELLKKDKKNYRIYLELAKCYLKLNDRKHAITTLDGFRKFGIRNKYINTLYNKIK